jgi:hypothetical protein
MYVNCVGCSFDLRKDFKFCPNCGIAILPSAHQGSGQASGIPDRYLHVARDFEDLTNLKLTPEQLERFVLLPEVGKLSVNSSGRRKKAGLKARVKNGNNTYILNIAQWLMEMYEIPDTNNAAQSRVWITPGGMKYHTTRDCKGLSDGQTYAAWKGKDTYNPQFVTRNDAQWFYGKKACHVCNPG